MRKKRRVANLRKSSKRAWFSRTRQDDEGEWFRFDEATAPVKVSPRKRVRRRLLFARLAALACFSVSIPLGVKWGYGKVFFQNEEFLLKSLVIQTDGVLGSDRLAEIANVAPGMNLMDLDLAAIQTQIEKLPQVEEAVVSRVLPDRLHLAIRERIPVAWLSSPPLGIRPWDMERGFLLDEDGVIFRCLDLNDGMKSLPVVESFKMVEPEEGRAVDSIGIRAGLKLILASDERFLSQGLTVRDVRVREEWAVECHYSSGLQASFGVYDYPRGLDDLALILAQMKESGKTLASVNLTATRNIPVTFAAVTGESAAPAGPEPSTTQPLPAEPSLPAAEPPVTEQDSHLQSILRGG